VIVFLLGGVIAKFTGELVAGVGSGAGLAYASILGRIVQYLVSLFVLIVALGALGIDTTVLVTSVPIVIASFGLALGLALGLGARAAVHNIIMGYYLRQRLPVGGAIQIAQASGTVMGIGPVTTLVSTDNGQIVIPNSTLADSVVQIPISDQPSTPQ
jgi:small-conductance mechanosensitive channel